MLSSYRIVSTTVKGVCCVDRSGDVGACELRTENISTHVDVEARKLKDGNEKYQSVDVTLWESCFQRAVRASRYLGSIQVRYTFAIPTIDLNVHIYQQLNMRQFKELQTFRSHGTPASLLHVLDELLIATLDALFSERLEYHIVDRCKLCERVRQARVRHRVAYFGYRNRISKYSLQYNLCEHAFFPPNSTRLSSLY